MKIRKLLMIPDAQRLEESVELAARYNAGFEYNDFFLPAFLEDKDGVEKRIETYRKRRQKPDYPQFQTNHGSFLDVTIFSDDPKIRAVSDYRIRESLEIAKRLSAESVIFHTNYITNFLQDAYRANWVSRNEIYWKEICAQYPQLNIYMENMFDINPDLLVCLAQRMKEVTNFGICFDYSHAQVFGDEKQIGEWVESLAPYVRHLHINDHDFCSDLHLAAGDGKTDWQKFRYYYESYFQEVPVLVEVTGLEKAEKSLEFLKNL